MTRGLRRSLGQLRQKGPITPSHYGLTETWQNWWVAFLKLCQFRICMSFKHNGTYWWLIFFHTWHFYPFFFYLFLAHWIFYKLTYLYIIYRCKKKPLANLWDHIQFFYWICSITVSYSQEVEQTVFLATCIYRHWRLNSYLHLSGSERGKTGRWHWHSILPV